VRPFNGIDRLGNTIFTIGNECDHDKRQANCVSPAATPHVWQAVVSAASAAATREWSPYGRFGSTPPRCDSGKISAVSPTELPALSDSVDPVIEAYKRDVDRTLIRENLTRSYEERVRALEQMIEFVDEVRRAGKSMRGEQS
jgi:hypothetical protein